MVWFVLGGNGCLRSPRRALAAACARRRARKRTLRRTKRRSTRRNSRRSSVTSSAACCRKGRRRALAPKPRAASLRRRPAHCQGSGRRRGVSPRRGGAGRARVAGDRLSPLCAPWQPGYARRAAGHPQSRAADGWRHRGGGRGGRGAPCRQARRWQGMGGDRAGLHALQRYADAAHAYAEALRLLGEDPLRRAAYGEALVAAAGGVVTDEARQAFDRALAGQPGQPQARCCMSRSPPSRMAKKPTPFCDYESLLANSPRDAPWRNMVDARLAALKGEPHGGGRGRNSRGSAADDRRHGRPARRRGSRQGRKHRRMVAPHSRLCGAA